MKQFDEYCTRLGFKVHSDTKGDALCNANETDSMLSILVKCFSNDSNILSNKSLPPAVIRECNLKSIYTIEDVRKYFNILTLQSRNALKALIA